MVLWLVSAGLLAAPALATPPTAAQRQMTAIVHAWSARLNASDNDGIAKLFALPAVFIQGAYEYTLTTRHEISLWHSGLPCSGTIVAISFHGRFATAVFRLGNRGKKKCDAPGTLAAAQFEIVGGKIDSWVQVPLPTQPKQGTGPIA